METSYLVGGMPGDAFNVLRVLHQDGEAFEICRSDSCRGFVRES